jgi:NitT/TauT family transport system substrate-binding protein
MTIHLKGRAKPPAEPCYRSNRLGFALAVILLWSFASNLLAQEPTLKKVTYIPHWVPQAQFAGFYMALEKGFYRQHGLDVTILRGGPEQPASAWIAEGKADFGTTFLATALEERSKGSPLVNIAQLVQRSALLLVAKKSSGIKSPADFTGKTVTIWPEFRLQPMALFRKFDVHPRILPQRNTMNLFLRGGADVASAMWYNEYHLLQNTGLDPDELTLFHYDEYDLNFPEDGIYCLEKTLRDDPEKCRAFVRASMEGWLYAFHHTEESLDVVMRYVKAANMPTTRVHHKWMLSVMKEIIMPGGDPSQLGRLSEQDYMRVARELKAGDMIETIPDFKSFYENCAK